MKRRDFIKVASAGVIVPSTSFMKPSLKLNKNKKHQNNPILKDENINVEENLALDEVSSSCLICHK